MRILHGLAAPELLFCFAESPAQARAQWKADKRRDDAKRAAANVVAESASATPEPQPQLAALLATASIEPEALPEVSAPSAVDLHRENS